MATFVIEVDGSRAGRAALDRVATRAGGNDRVVVVGAVRRRWNGRRLVVELDDLVEGQRHVDAARRMLFSAGVGARTMVAVGEPIGVLAGAAAAVDGPVVVAHVSRRAPRALRARRVRRLERRLGCPVEVVAG